MGSRKKTAKNIGIGCIALFLIVLIVGLTTTPKDKTRDAFEQGKKAGTEVALSLQDKELTEDSVRQVISQIKDTGYKVDLTESIKEITVAGEEGKKIVTVKYKPNSVWNEKDAVERGVNTSVFVFEALFSNPSVSRVAVFQLGDFTDKYGQTEEETAIKVMMDREQADKINWDGLKQNVLLDPSAISEVVSDFNIHQSLQD